MGLLVISFKISHKINSHFIHYFLNYLVDFGNFKTVITFWIWCTRYFHQIDIFRCPILKQEYPTPLWTSNVYQGTDLVQTCPWPSVCPSQWPAGCPVLPGSVSGTPGIVCSGAAPPLGSQPPLTGSGQGGASAWPAHSAVN